MKTNFPIIAAFTFFIALITYQPAQSQQKDTGLKYGKYGCTASKYVGGYYQYTAKGSFTLSKSGTYIYSGFKKPSSGRFSIDEKGNLSFKGGYLNGGKAEKIDRPHKFFLTFPSNPDNRWTCGCVEK